MKSSIKYHPIQSRSTAPSNGDRLPMAALLALTLTSFIATANETVPAGLLPQIAQSFGISQAWAGQLVTFCALGSGLAAIPLTLAMRGWRRRPLLLLAISVFLLCNLLTALTNSYALTLLARFMVGCATGLAWSLLAGYARRMVVPALQGKAMALAMLGIPLALAFGVPLSAWLGKQISWQNIFGIMSTLSLLLLVWVLLKVPDYPAPDQQQRPPMRQVWQTPGVRSVLLVMIFWILAHYSLYTYIAPFLSYRGFANHLDSLLLVFGVSAMFGIGFTGLLVDNALRALVLGCLAVFALVALLLAFHGAGVWGIYLGIALWGLSFGGSPTLLQTALADAAGKGADVAQSMLVTAFNLAFAGSGILGGVLLTTIGIGYLPTLIFSLALMGLCIAVYAKQSGFKAGRRADHAA